MKQSFKFKIPTDEELIDATRELNPGLTSSQELLHIVATTRKILQRLTENGLINIKSSLEGNE